MRKSASKIHKRKLFPDETEMRSIRKDNQLIKNLKRGSLAAKNKRGRLVKQTKKRR
ncbi:hypothetical protein ACFL6Y_04955 [Elusimicrobiota bacterium]